jgi:putative Holliday junction resolvase
MTDARHGARAPETLLGFDFGVRRIGVSLGNTLTGDARPLAIVDAVPVDRRFERIAALLREWAPARLVVGRPLDEDGAETETTRRTDRFANQLRGRFGLPVERVDERFSSREAQAIIASAKGRPQDEDGVAAAVILGQYLDGLRRAPGPDPSADAAARAHRPDDADPDERDAAPHPGRPPR